LGVRTGETWAYAVTRDRALRSPDSIVDDWEAEDETK
jgi:hypothetical protein